MKNILFFLLYISSLPSMADGIPELGDISQATVSPQQERQIGEQSMFQIRADRRYLDDPEISDYLNQIGYQLVANSNEPSQPFEFFALNDNSINAFALPGGFVGVNTGLILITQSESELASVLAHEITHVTQHHIAHMIAGQKTDTLTSLAGLAVAILAARSNPGASQAAIAGSQAASIQRKLNFTRAFEKEADRLGLAILGKAGFDVHAMPIFLERMQRATRLVDGNLPSYFRTHPVTSERIADIANRVQQIPYHLTPDSLSFHLIRAKLFFMQKTPAQAVTFFTTAMGAKKYGNQTAQRYGLALALLNSGQAVRAMQAFAPLRDLSARNPMLARLEGQIMQANNSPNLVTYYRTATQNFPQQRALAYDYVELLLQAKRYKAALKLLNEQIISHPNDPHLYERQASSYAALGKLQQEHHALAYTYALHGDLFGAIEQLELAKQSGTDFYELSTIEGELREFRAIAAAQSKH